MRKVVCLSSKTGAVVSDEHCLKIGNKPNDAVKPCHSKCKLRYVGVTNDEGQLNLLGIGCIQGVL